MYINYKPRCEKLPAAVSLYIQHKLLCELLDKKKKKKEEEAINLFKTLFSHSHIFVHYNMGKLSTIILFHPSKLWQNNYVLSG